MRALSPTAVKAALAQETEEAFLVLLTLSAEGLASPIRVTSDGVDTVSRGQTFLSYPFRIQLPEEWGGDDAPPGTVTLEIDNVERSIVIAARQLGRAPTVLIEVVLASQPDTVEAAFDLGMPAVRWDPLTVTGTLALEPVLNEPWPGDGMDPSNFPGLFR